MSDSTKDPHQRNRDAIALAIGKIVMAWNEFHETLAETYAEICGRDKWQQSLEEWRSILNDRAQRMKLLEAAKANLIGRALEETIWVVENTDTLLANQRNIGVHMPRRKTQLGRHCSPSLAIRTDDRRTGA